MSKSMLGNASLSFIPSYEYTDDGFVFLSTGKIFMFLGDGGVAPYLSTKTPVSAFVISSNNILKAISGRQYGVFDVIQCNPLPMISLKVAHLDLVGCLGFGLLQLSESGVVSKQFHNRLLEPLIIRSVVSAHRSDNLSVSFSNNGILITVYRSGHC